jgi:hypothetical protein
LSAGNKKYRRNQNLLTETIGADMVCNVVCLPSVGASGGILIAASEWFFKVQQTHQTLNTVSASITMLTENKVWSITGVYGPQADSDKTLFFARNQGSETTCPTRMATS